MNQIFKGLESAKWKKLSDLFETQNHMKFWAHSEITFYLEKILVSVNKIPPRDQISEANHHLWWEIQTLKIENFVCLFDYYS